MYIYILFQNKHLTVMVTEPSWFALANTLWTILQFNPPFEKDTVLDCQNVCCSEGLS